MTSKELNKQYQIESRKLKDTSFLDTKTGEITKVGYDYIHLDNTTKGLSSKFASNNLSRSDDPFFNVFLRFNQNLKNTYNLSFNELGQLLVLMSYTNYRNLEDKRSYIILKQRNVQSNSQLKSILNISDSSVRKIKKKLIDNNILFEDEKGLYFLDSFVARGKIYKYNRQQNKQMYKILIKTIHKIAETLQEEGNKNKYKALGFLFSLLPFIKVTNEEDKKKGLSASHNVLVTDSINTYNEHIPIKKDELAQHLGVSKSTIYDETRRLNKVMRQIYDEDLIFEMNFTLRAVGSKSNTYKTKQWIINPRFSYSSDKTSEEYKMINTYLEQQKSNDSSDVA